MGNETVADVVREWHVTDRGACIRSRDFAHDVVLNLSGDFADTDERITYAEHIANTLNSEAAHARDVEALRDKNRALHRRCQDAEAALTDYRKIIALPPDGDGVRFVSGSMGRALLVGLCQKQEAEIKSLRAMVESVYRHLMHVAPWSESNDMTWADEMICGIDLMKQDLADAEKRAEAAEGAMRTVASTHEGHMALAKAIHIELGRVDAWLDAAIASGGEDRK